MFELESVNNNGNYTLQLALASANEADLEVYIYIYIFSLYVVSSLLNYGFLVINCVGCLKVRFNDASAKPSHFSTGSIGRENAIARHGIHGLYWLASVDVASNVLQEGNNTIYLTQSKSRSPFQGVMYDYLRLEGPPPEG